MMHPNRQLLLAHLEGEMNDAEVMMHVGQCAECQHRITEIGAALATFAGALSELDATEPVSWHSHGSASNHSRPDPITGVHDPLRVDSRRRIWKAAAAMLFTVATAASALVVARPLLQPARESGMETTTGTTAGGTDISAVIVTLSADSFDVFITNPGPDSRAHVVPEDRRNARIEVAGVSAAHFEYEANRATVNLYGASAIIQIHVPQRVHGNVVVDGEIVARFTDDPAETRNRRTWQIALPARPEGS